MKKTQKIKKVGLTAAALLVCFAFIFTCFTFAKPTTAFAATPTSTTVSDKDLFDGISLPEEVNYGESFTVPAASDADVKVKVLSPDGTEAAIESNSVKVNQVGNYTVRYFTDAGFKYDFIVSVNLEEKLFLRVDHNGADIPTYMKRNETVKFPGAGVYYYDENKILQKYEDATISIIDSLDASVTHKTGDDFTPTTTGKKFITYYAKVGANGTKTFSQTFTVNVQNTLSDSDASAPTLSVSGVPSTASVRRPVTLPKATATDSYDENVKIEITVTGPTPSGEEVLNADIDRYGYAYRKADKEYSKVAFDNDEAMTFYPIETGTYVIRYTAVNDAGKTASPREFYMTCDDSAAPVFEDTKDFNIPETWGVTVKKGTEGSEEADENLSGKILFPVPTVVDNNDHMYAEDKDDTNLISLLFRITDSDNSRTVLEFTNILAPEGDSGREFKANSTYGDEGTTYTFTKDGFLFEFDKYHKKDSTNEKDAELPGTYTVYYRARDKAQNTSSRTFTITLEDEFVDTAKPSTAEVTVPAYVSEKDGEMTIPSPSVADANDSRPQVIYRIYTDNGATEEADRYIDVEGGEKAEFINESDKLYLVIDNGKEDNMGRYEKKLQLGEHMYFYVKAIDKVGNFKTNTVDGSEDPTKSEAVTKVVTAVTDKAYTLDATGVTLNSVGDIFTGDTVNAGSFVIKDIPEEMRNYTGFEVSVLDPSGSAVNVTLDTYSLIGSDSKAEINVKNIKFKASVEGDHYLNIRAFDVNGRSTVKSYKFNVLRATSGGGSTSASVIGTTGSVNVKYKLHNETMTGIGDKNDAADEKYYVVRQIRGGIFSLMGSEFTAKTQGSYAVRDGYVKKSVLDGTDGYKSFDESATPYGGNNGKYSFSVTDTAAPVIEIQDVMPVYAAKSTTENPSVVTLPSVIAYTENGNATVTVKITHDKTGKEVKPTYDEATNRYSFEGKSDGSYTVTYTATYMKATPATATYTINIGDVEGPEFTVSGGSNGRMVVGNTFTFGNMVLDEGSSDKEKDVTITKTLIDPSKNEVSSATVSGSFSSYKNKENNGTEITLSMAGQYEVVYTAKDAVGNVTTQRYTITVVSSGSGTPTTITTLSTVLIIVAVVLLAGVIVYVVRFRKVKEKKNKA